MNKKIILIVIAVLLLSAAAFWGYLKLRENTLSDKTNLYTAISSRATFILETKNLKDFSETLSEEKDVWQLITTVDIFSGIADFVNKINQLSENNELQQIFSKREFLVLYNKISDNPLLMNGILLGKITSKEAKESTKYIGKLFDCVKTGEINYRTEKITVFCDSIGTPRFYTLYKDGIFIAAAQADEMKKTIDLLEDRAANLCNDFNFNTVRATAGKNALATIFVNAKLLAPIFAENIKDDFPALKAKIAAFPEWIGLDISLENGQLLANGYSNNADGFIYASENQAAAENNICSDLPENTCFFLYQNIGDFADFKAKQFNSPTFRSEQFFKDFFDGEMVSGFAVVDKKPLHQTNFTMFSIKDSTLVAERLENAGKKSVHFPYYILRGDSAKYAEVCSFTIYIYELPRRYGLTAVFDDNATALKDLEFATVIGRYVLVADNVDFLIELVRKIISGQTLATDALFSTAKENCSSNLAVFYYANFPVLLKYADEIFENSFAEKIIKNQDKLSDIQSIGWQMQNERRMIYHNIFLHYNKTTSVNLPAENPPVEETPKENPQTKLLWKTTLSEKSAPTAVIVHNKATGADEILIQDTKNNLHFYDHNGKLQWSVALESPILGNEINQIDYYKNNKYQFLFNTAKKLYIIDRKGHNIGKYPLDLPSEASAPLAVFDYENTKEYRIFIPAQDKKIYLYKKEGTRPSDWQFEKTENVAKLPVQYISTSNKDYLCVNDGTRAYILNRRGEERIKLKTDFNIAPDSKFYLRKTAEGSFFFVFDKQGYVKRIDTEGNVKSYPSDSPEVAALKLEKTNEKPQNLPNESALYMGQLKPLTNSCVLTFNNGELFCYELK